MTATKKKLTCILLAAGALATAALGVGLGVGLKNKTAFAYTVEFTAAEIEENYYLNDTLTLPASITAEYNGQSYTLSESSLRYPNGTVRKQSKYVLNELGKYVVTYSKRLGNSILQAERSFYVIEKNWQVGNANSTVEYGALSITGGGEGLKVSLADGDTFTYNVPVDVNKGELTDLITVYSPQTTSSARAQKLIVRATDCYNANNYVDFLIDYSNGRGNSIYARAGTSISDSTGIINRQDAMNVKPGENRKFLYINGEEHIIWYNMWGAPMKTGDSATSNSGFTWQYNSANKEVHVVHQRGNTLVTQFANAEIYGKATFEGFTTGEVYVSVFAEDYLQASMNFEIARIADFSGAQLGAANYKDEKAPKLEVDFTPTEGNCVYVAQGDKVKLFPATATDVSGATVSTEVYYNYDLEKYRTAVYCKDGAFIASQLGAYTIIYTARDSYGNETTKEIVVNSVATESGKAIDLTFEKLTQINAGVEATLPACSASGLNGDVTVVTRVIAPNGKAEEIKDNTFIPLNVGVYTVEYRYYDAVCSYVTTYTVESAPSDAQRFFTDISHPRYFIKGAKYDLDNIKAYIFTSAEPTPVDTAFYVKFDGGDYAAANVSEFTITGDSSVQFKYVYGGAELESEEVEIIDVGYTAGALQVSKYFQGNFTAEEQPSYTAYTSNVNTGSNALHFINVMSLANFSVDFTVPRNVYYKAVRFTLTDFYDSSVKTVIELSAVDGGLGMKIDGVLYKCNDSFANGKQKTLQYSNSNRRFLLSNNASEHYFTKFASDFCFLDIELVDITGAASVQIHKVNNQPFGTLTGDRIQPVIQARNVSGQRRLNEVIELSAASITDVLSPALQKSLTLSVRAPSGDYVTSDSGVLLKNVSGQQAYSFTATQYGNYRVIYRGEDGKGREAQSTFIVIIEDDVPPDINITCDKVVHVPHLTVYKIKDFEVSDNISAAEKITVTIIVMDEGNNTVFSVGEEFRASYKGEYVVYIYCADEAGNASYATYTLVVDDAS